MSFDSTGIQPLRYDEILTLLNNRLKENLGQPVDTSENSVLGHMHSNIAYSFAELWEMGQGVYDSTNLFNAEGEGLDNLAILAGIVRLPAQQTQGNAFFEGRDGTEIPLGTQISSLRGDLFATRFGFNITSTRCVTSRLYVSLVLPETDYVVVLDEQQYVHTTTPDPTRQEILEDLATKIASGTVATTVVLDPENDENSYVEIDLIEKTSTITLGATTYIYFDYVVTPAPISSEVFGPIPGDALSINTIVVGSAGWYSVINPSDLTLGSSIETDAELRERIIDDFTTVGSGTVESILANVDAVENVAGVFVKENTSNVTDPSGIPPKSYEVVVHEGLDQDIADVIWRTKPAGIHLHATPPRDVEVQVIDYNGYEKTVRFSRPDEQFIHIQVYYDTYDEETFVQASAEEAAKEAMLAYGSTLSIDNDVIAKRFIQHIYNASDGFGDVTVLIAATDLVGDDPTGTFVEDVIPISQDEVSSFAINRMEFFNAPAP